MVWQLRRHHLALVASSRTQSRDRRLSRKGRFLDSEDKREVEYKSSRLSPGGTPGGLGMFLFGLGLAIAGGYLIMNQVQVTSAYWNWWGANTFGLTLIPLIIGIGLLFFNGKSLIGWLLAGGGLVVILVGVIANLGVYFRQTSLINVLIMLTMFAAGLGLMARSFKGR